MMQVKCPKCGGSDCVKFGYSGWKKKRQRYRCKSCKSSFTVDQLPANQPTQDTSIHQYASSVKTLTITLHGVEIHTGGVVIKADVATLDLPYFDFRIIASTGNVLTGNPQTYNTLNGAVGGDIGNSDINEAKSCSDSESAHQLKSALDVDVDNISGINTSNSISYYYRDHDEYLSSGSENDSTIYDDSTVEAKVESTDSENDSIVVEDSNVTDPVAGEKIEKTRVDVENPHAGYVDVPTKDKEEVGIVELNKLPSVDEMLMFDGAIVAAPSIRYADWAEMQGEKDPEAKALLEFVDRLHWGRYKIKSGLTVGDTYRILTHVRNLGGDVRKAKIMFRHIMYGANKWFEGNYNNLRLLLSPKVCVRTLREAYEWYRYRQAMLGQRKKSKSRKRHN